MVAKKTSLPFLSRPHIPKLYYAFSLFRCVSAFHKKYKTHVIP